MLITFPSLRDIDTFDGIVVVVVLFFSFLWICLLWKRDGVERRVYAAALSGNERKGNRGGGEKSIL